MFSMFDSQTYTPVSPGGTLLHVSERRRPGRWPDDRARFWDTVGPVVDRDAASRKLGAEVRRRERALRLKVKAAAWREYVALEEVTARRSLRWIEVAAAWAYLEGARRRRSR
jgi:hypothetical protein